MTALVRNNLFILLFILWLPACAGADTANLYQRATVKDMPRSTEDLKLVKSDERLADIRTLVPGGHSIFRYEVTASGMPFIVDSASRKEVIIVFDSEKPNAGKQTIGNGILSAYLISGPPSMPVGAHCLGMATTGFVDIELRKA